MGEQSTAAVCPRSIRTWRAHTRCMVETRGDTYRIDGSDDVVVHRSVQDLWRAQNAAWRARVLTQLRPIEELAPQLG